VTVPRAPGDDDDGYLSPDERELRAREKELQAISRGLTPDWFQRRGDVCLPPGGLDVAVVGGGFAGLSAAWYLKRCGARVVVYEARGRIGGRVETDRAFVHPKTIEAGAELIGENHALWRIDARELGLKLVPLSTESSYPGLAVRMRLKGRFLSSSEKQRMEEDVHRAQLAIGHAGLAIDEVEPWHSPEAGRLDGISVATGLVPFIGAGPSLAREWFEFTLANDNCATIAQQSYLGLLASVSAARMGSDERGMLGYWRSTETHLCEYGNDLLAEGIGQRLGSSVRVGTYVEGLILQPTFYPPVVVFSARRDASGALVGRRHEGFHYAILAAPPTVWGAIGCQPPFRAAERTVYHGPAIKFLTRYPTEFWRRERNAPQAKSDEIGSVWEGTDKQGGSAPFALSVFSGGPFVQKAGEYPEKLTSLYPTRTSSPGSERFVDWPTTPYIQTGYAVPVVGQVSTIFPAQLRPHAERLYFAGEQTSPGFFGYMEGALQSGARAARDILLAAAVPCPQVAMGDSKFTGGGGDFGGGGAGDSF
jgi:monoamine oxidase